MYTLYIYSATVLLKHCAEKLNEFDASESNLCTQFLVFILVTKNLQDNFFA